QQANGAAGRYDIFNQRSDVTALPPGAVSVLNYVHSGPGQASVIPVITAAGKLDGTAGPGSEGDQLRGTDGQNHAFTSTQPASFTGGVVQLYGFVFTYNDGRAFYTGTVADDGKFGLSPGVTTKTVAGGTYSIFVDGTTTRANGSVAIDRFVAGDAALIPVHGGAADGTQGLGSEAASLSLGGPSAGVSSSQEPKLARALPPGAP